MATDQKALQDTLKELAGKKSSDISPADKEIRKYTNRANKFLKNKQYDALAKEMYELASDINFAESVGDHKRHLIPVVASMAGKLFQAGLLMGNPGEQDKYIKMAQDGFIDALRSAERVNVRQTRAWAAGSPQDPLADGISDRLIELMDSIPDIEKCCDGYGRILQEQHRHMSDTCWTKIYERLVDFVGPDAAKERVFPPPPTPKPVEIFTLKDGSEMPSDKFDPIWNAIDGLNQSGDTLALHLLRRIAEGDRPVDGRDDVSKSTLKSCRLLSSNSLVSDEVKKIITNAMECRYCAPVTLPVLERQDKGPNKAALPTQHL